MNRRTLLSSGIASALGVSLTVTEGVSAKSPAKVFEYTFLKSKDNEIENLIRFIKLNWFAMDKIAVERGLMTSYYVFESPGEKWDVVVAVGYPKREGYAAISTDFEAIRKVHKTILIDGKALKDLGAVVESRKFFPRLDS